jgi:hypothetical protein
MEQVAQVLNTRGHDCRITEYEESVAKSGAR